MRPVTRVSARDRRAAASGIAGSSLANEAAAPGGESAAADDAGLTDEAARALRERHGFNESATADRWSPLRALGHFAASPLILLLAIAAVVSAVLGERVDAAIIGLMVVLGIAIDFVQTYRSARAVERLQATVAPTATVMRDGRWQELPRREIVPGDLVKLCAGDLVPADCRLLSSHDLHVAQAALTGESLPVEKRSGVLPVSRDADAAHMVFLGTSVVSGTATARVAFTGAATAFGDIAARLAHHPPPTEFERGTRQFGLFIARTVLFLVLFIVMVSVLLHRDAFQSLLFAVALAVGMTPEFLPMITTVTLARGAVRMGRAHVIVKQLAAIQNLGSIDVLCSDKTGTLTTGSTALERTVDIAGNDAPRVLEHGYLNAVYETGIKSPLDAAILARPCTPAEGWRKTDEIPFDFERRRVSVVLQHDAQHLLVTKGAPESVLPLCSAVERDGRRIPFDDAEQARAQATFGALGEEGLRVLAVAIAAVTRPDGLDAGDERDLTLLGFLAFCDPPRDDAAAMLERLRADGVVVKILTGDNEPVARHVCARVGLPVDDVLSGADIGRLTDAALGKRAEEVALFARLSPGQKNRISDGAQESRPRRRLPRRRHQRCAFLARRRCRHLGRQRRRRGARRRRGHPHAAGPRRPAYRHRRGAARLRQRAQVPAHGHQLQLRQHAVDGGRVALLAVPADAADADPAQ